VEAVVHHSNDPLEMTKWVIRYRRIQSQSQPMSAPQHHHLMPKRDVFCLKPALRLEWQDQNGNEAVERQHCALTLGDSLS